MEGGRHTCASCPTPDRSLKGVTVKYRLLALTLIIVAAGVYIYITTTGATIGVGKGPGLLFFREDT